MKYLSVCSGIEAATVAWHRLGWEPVGFSEIEPFPSAVLAHHYPHVPNFGDMTKFQEWPLDAGAVDLLVGGTPCQSFSVAGLRQGLKDPRGNLMLTYLAIAARLRPRWVVWENVPGVLSSNGGRDFGSLLGGLVQLGYGISYRILDAQWMRTYGHPCAVPQRRRRVFVVGCLGDATAAAKVLFERESVQRHSAKSGAAREEVASDVEGRVGAGCWWDGGNTSDTLTKCGANGARRMPDKDNFGAVLQPFDQQQNGAYGIGQVGSTRLAREHKGPTDLVAVPVMSMDEECNPGIEMIGPIIRGGGGGRHDCVAVPIQDGREINKQQNGIGVGQPGDPAYTLDTTGAQAVYTKAKRAQSDTDDETWVEGQVNPTLSLFDCGDVRATTSVVHGVAQAMTVRRLLPIECERLQGFPDDYTLIPWRKKAADDCPDGPRYKALGNSMAVNCMEWIGERIAAFEAERGTT